MEPGPYRVPTTLVWEREIGAMRKFGVLGALVFALLVAASPVAASVAPTFEDIGTGGPYVMHATTPHAGRYLFTVRAGSPLYDPCSFDLSWGKRYSLSLSVPLRSSYLVTSVVRLPKGRFTVTVAGDCFRVIKVRVL
jgi:hypothetical protein